MKLIPFGIAPGGNIASAGIAISIAVSIGCSFLAYFRTRGTGRRRWTVVLRGAGSAGGGAATGTEAVVIVGPTSGGSTRVRGNARKITAAATTAPASTGAQRGTERAAFAAITASQ